MAGSGTVTAVPVTGAPAAFSADAVPVPRFIVPGGLRICSNVTRRENSPSASGEAKLTNTVEPFCVIGPMPVGVVPLKSENVAKFTLLAPLAVTGIAA